MAIKNILFDMGGVLFIQDTEAAFHKFGEAGLDPNVYMGIYGQKEFFLELEEGKIDMAEFCRRMSEVCGRAVGWQEAQDCWLAFISGVSTERLHRLEELRKDYVLGLLSNTNPFIMAFTDSDRYSEDSYPISHYLDHLFLSYQMGICKPSLEIYRRVLEEGNFKAEETVFVDDSLKNIKAAEECGIHGLHVPTNEDWWPYLSELLSKTNEDDN